MAEKQAITKEMAGRYATAPKKQRGLMLDELCALAGYNRSYAARLLRERARGPAPAKRPRVRPRMYEGELLAPLRKVWAILDRPCGKRLSRVMATTLDVLERHGELKLSDEQRELLCSASAATLDRLLSPERRRLHLKGRTTTKPGSPLEASGQVGRPAGPPLEAPARESFAMAQGSPSVRLSLHPQGSRGADGPTWRWRHVSQSGTRALAYVTEVTSQSTSSYVGAGDRADRQQAQAAAGSAGSRPPDSSCPH